MQLFPIILVAILLLAEGGLGLAADDLRLDPGAILIVVWVPVLLVPAVTVGGVRLARKRLAAGGGPAAVLKAERLARIARAVLLVHFAIIVLVFGWLNVVRGVVGDVILADEILALAPPLAGIAATWWAYYPIERRVREAALVRRLDLGRTVYPTPGRARYVLDQLRLHVLLLLVPILVILAAAELIDHAVARGAWAQWVGDAVTLAAAAAVVMCAPLLARLVLTVEPVPDGPLREQLLNVCRAHRVRVLDILTWKTHGTMINAAVIGLVGRLRYVLLTDALLEAMDHREIEAVMAHEIGHVRRRHMPWLLVSLLATITVVAMPLMFVQLPNDAADPPVFGRMLTTAAVVSAGVVVFCVFGWISRRFERQADTFAVRHLSGADSTVPAPSPTAEAVATMCNALEMIARLNGVARERPSWRHGSIRWRQAYLVSIAGRPPGSLEVDRQLRWIKTTAVAILLVGVLFATLTPRLIETAQHHGGAGKTHRGDAETRRGIHLVRKDEGPAGQTPVHLNKEYVFSASPRLRGEILLPLRWVRLLDHDPLHEDAWCGQRLRLS